MPVSQGLGNALGNEAVTSEAVKRLPRAQSVRLLLGKQKLDMASVQVFSQAGQSKKQKVVMSLRKMIWTFFQDPYSGTGAFWWSIWILLLIMTSCAAFIIESDPM